MSIWVYGVRSITPRSILHHFQEPPYCTAADIRLGGRKAFHGASIAPARGKKLFLGLILTGYHLHISFSLVCCFER